jgi:hypothetical protein
VPDFFDTALTNGSYVAATGTPPKRR